MKKAGKFTAVFLAFAMIAGIFCGIPGAAAGSDFTIDSNGVLTKYNGTDTNVTIPDGVKAIGDGAFQMDYALTSVVIPDSVGSIGTQAFLQCDHLSSVTLGKGLKVIGISAFDGCKALTDIVISDGTTTIGENAFRFSGLESVTLPNGLNTIGIRAFGNTKLKSVIIPEGVTKICDGAFSDCAALANVIFPATLTDFGQEIFDRTEWLQKYPDDFVVVNGVLIAYKGNGGDIVVPGTVKKISPYVLSGTLALTHVTVSDGVTEIGDHAFERDANLTGVSLPDSLTRIGQYAFQQSGLTSMILPKNLTELGSFAFEECDSLKTVSIPGSLNLISNNAFFWCRALSGVTLAPGIQSIGNAAFDGCSALRTIALPSGLKTIGNQAFLGCTSLTGISLPNSVTSLGNGAFMRCSHLSSLTLSTGLKNLSPEVFRECPELQTLSIPNGVKCLGACSFLDCTLASVFIPVSVEVIDASAFNSSERQRESVPKIYGYTGTEAQRFAAKYKYTFVSLGFVPVPLSLDTRGTYDFGSRNTYFYLARTGAPVAPTAVSSNPKAVTASFVQKAGNGYLFRINRVGQGTAVITTRINNEVASFTAQAGPSVKSDTTRNFAMKKGAYYTFKISVLSTSSAAPQFYAGSSNVLKVQYMKKSGKDFFFRVQAVGTSKSCTGVYAKMPGESGPLVCAVTVS